MTGTRRHDETDARADASRDRYRFEWTTVRETLRFVAGAPLRHKALATACFLFVTGASAALLRVVPFRYRAEATILAQHDTWFGSIANPGAARGAASPTELAREAVLRRDNLVAICKRTNLVQRHLERRAPAVRAAHRLRALLKGDRAPRPGELTDGMVDALAQRLFVSTDFYEGTVTFSFEWSDPELARDVVAAAIDNFIADRRAAIIAATTEAASILEEDHEKVRKEIERVSKKIAAQQAAHARRSALEPDPRLDERNRELVELEGRLKARRDALAELEANWRRRMVELQELLTQQLNVYAPEHPIIADTRQGIEKLARAASAIDGLRLEVHELEQEVARRGGRVHASPLAAAAEVQGDPAGRTRFKFLAGQEANLRQRIDQARLEKDIALAANRYTIVRPPKIPKRPVKPKPVTVVIGGVLGGIAYALFACCALDLTGGARRVLAQRTSTPKGRS